MGELERAVEPVVVGQRERLVAQLDRAGAQLLGLRGPVQKGVGRVGMELDIGRRSENRPVSLTCSERIFALQPQVLVRGGIESTPEATKPVRRNESATAEHVPPRAERQIGYERGREKKDGAAEDHPVLASKQAEGQHSDHR